MNFKRYKELKATALASLANREAIGYPIEAEAVEREDALSLAYIGDAVYSLYVRERLVGTGITKVQVLHALATECICAKGQAEALGVIEPMLTETEIRLVRRARNADVNVPRSATVGEYRASTAFEALLGYLHRTGRRERLETLMETALRAVLHADGGASEQGGGR